MKRTQERWTVEIGEAILGHNAELAARNRQRFQEHGLRVVNLVSSPGSGKTALLERTLTDRGSQIGMGVIVGDLATDNDAERLRGKGAPVVQITTGSYCHLEASMVAQALEKIDLPNVQLLFIENVGNLVCPAAYDLGEDTRVALLSVTEGEDKPLKYPVIFRSADLVLINKIDLLPYLDFDMARFHQHLNAVNPGVPCIATSARTGEGMDAWYSWLLTHNG